MSGGVDSSAGAALLVQQGYDVIGLTMQIWQESQTDARHAGCCSLGAVEDARRVARVLDIPYYVLNFREDFRQKVIDQFVDEYARGRTPNPCVNCNRYVKFDLLLSRARELGCEKLATGHYAQVKRHSNGRYAVARAVAKEKDQSYALYASSQEQLAHMHFPLGTMTDKAETRRLAADAGLSVAEKPDSQEICFVSEAGGYREFLMTKRPEAFQIGEIRDVGGQMLGTHGGLAQYTIGQRKGIGVAPDSRPRYVVSLDMATNTLVVGDDQDLRRDAVTVDDVVWSGRNGLTQPLRVKAKIRYNMEACDAVLYPQDDAGRLTARFVQPVRAVTPGQIAVFYSGECIVAGGTIVSEADAGPNRFEEDLK